MSLPTSIFLLSHHAMAWQSPMAPICASHLEVRVFPSLFLLSAMVRSASKQARTGTGAEGKGGGRLPFGLMRHDVDELSPASALYYYEVSQASGLIRRLLILRTANTCAPQRDQLLWLRLGTADRKRCQGFGMQALQALQSKVAPHMKEQHACTDRHFNSQTRAPHTHARTNLTACNMKLRAVAVSCCTLCT